MSKDLVVLFIIVGGLIFSIVSLGLMVYFESRENKRLAKSIVERAFKNKG